MSLWFLINIAQLCFSKKKMLNYVVYTYGAHLLHHYLFIFPDRQGRASSATSIVVWKPNIQGQVQSFSCFLKILDRNSLLVCSFGDKYLLAIDLNLKTNLLFSVLIYLWRWFSLLLVLLPYLTWGQSYFLFQKLHCIVYMFYLSYFLISRNNVDDLNTLSLLKLHIVLLGNLILIPWILFVQILSVKPFCLSLLLYPWRYAPM